MGEVWRAYDTVIDRIVAIKIFRAEISETRCSSSGSVVKRMPLRD